MIQKYIACILFLFLVLSGFVFAQDDDVQSEVEYKVHKMKIVLNLTESQADAVKPIIKDYMIKRLTILGEAADQGLVDHVAVKSTLKGLKDIEYKKLSEILSEDQMKKWIDKENLMAVLNPDRVESKVEDGASLSDTGTGVGFQF